MTPQENEKLLRYIRDSKSRLDHNRDVLCILEGDLLQFVEKHFYKEFTEGDSVKQVLPRIAPINFLKKIIDRLSKIYQIGVKRTLVDGSEQDEELLRWYEEITQMNAVMNVGNEYFNTFKTNLNQLFISSRMPKLRAIPNDRFLVYSDNKEDETLPTHIILPMGSVKKLDKRYASKYREVDQFAIWKDDEAYYLDSELKVEPLFDSGEFDNPLGLDLFMYVNRSRYFLNPPMDTDTKRMTVLLAVLISDLNYAAKFQAFSIMYGININDEGLKMKPNAFWNFTTQDGMESPQLGQLTPQAQIGAIIELIAMELGAWLNSRGLRPGSISGITSDNLASGISKLVDEADTSDERKKQVEHYKAAEQDWWTGVISNVHNTWVDQMLIDQQMRFNESARVAVDFPPQIPLMSRGDLVKDLLSEVQAGFLSTETAMLKLNPHWSRQELEEERMKIEEERTVEIDASEMAEG